MMITRQVLFSRHALVVLKSAVLDFPRTRQEQPFLLLLWVLQQVEGLVDHFSVRCGACEPVLVMVIVMIPVRCSCFRRVKGVVQVAMVKLAHRFRFAANTRYLNLALLRCILEPPLMVAQSLTTMTATVDACLGLLIPDELSGGWCRDPIILFALLELPLLEQVEKVAAIALPATERSTITLAVRHRC